VDLADHVRTKDRVAEIRGRYVLREKVDLALEVIVHDRLHACLAVSEFPVAGHDVDAEKLLRADHVLSLGPQRRRRALPGVAPVEQQRSRARRLEALHQRRKMREAAHLPVGAREALEVEIRERVRLARPRLHAVRPEELIADAVMRIAALAGDADVYRR